MSNYDDIDKPNLTPSQYENLHGGGAEASEIASQRLSRRRFMRRSMLAVWGLSAASSIGGALYMLYPNLSVSTTFGGSLIVGKKADFEPGKPEDFKLDTKGVFHRATARTYIVHLSADTAFSLQGQAQGDQMGLQKMVKDSDNTYWLALYQRCVHLGCTVPFRDDCVSFKCPCHGSHYNVDGGYLDGPAPRSLDRFDMTFQGDDVVVNTGVITDTVLQPDASTRLIPAPTVECGAGSTAGGA
jgi:cytochrome b6-f complex iron-sulfur subunit